MLVFNFAITYQISTMFSHIEFSHSDGVATIHFNRPEVYHAINDLMATEINEAVKQTAKNEDIRVLVISATGKAFCSGQDLKEMGEIPADFSFAETVKRKYNPIITGLRQLSKPVIAKVQGVAAGAGCSLALAADVIIASDQASFAELFVQIGLVLDSGSSFFLPRLVGYAKAFELSTLGDKISALEAEKIGMINKVVAAEELDQAVAEMALRYSKMPTKSIGLIKRMLNRSFESSLDQMLEMEMYFQEIAGRTLDFREGFTAFKEKRKPVFVGK